MSVTRTSNSSTSTTDASARLAAAIERSSQPAPAAKPDATTAALTPAAKPAPLVAAAARHAGSTVRGTTTATRDASVGAHAAPDNAAATSEAANNVQSVAPGADTTGGGSTSSDAYSPYQASTDAYASQGPGTAPAGTAPAGEAPADASSSSTPSTSSSSSSSSSTSDATDAAGSAPAAQATGSTQATGAWTPKWESTFESLQLAPADIAYLAQGNFTDQQLAGIAQELGGVDALDPSAPQPGVDAGSVASANGPTAADVAPGQPGVTGAQEAADGAGAVQGTSAWSPEWKTKFTDVMTKMGMPKAEIDQQLAAVGNQPITEDQLNEAYRQMSGSLGAYDDGWKTKFTTLMDKLKVPAAEREQVMQQLAGSGLTEAQLQEAYSK
ncbi:MAG: hypothetical protein JWM98_3254, partial [Thermoleophilia bacterium]|nr:hypothetical protein [Thermoleophilia bacterium]